MTENTQDVNEQVEETTEEVSSAPGVIDQGVVTMPEQVELVVTMPEPTVEPVVEEVAAPVVETTQVQEVAAQVTLTPAQTNLIAALDLYLDKMAPRKPINEVDGARQQYNLFSAIRNVIENAEPTEFRKLWTTLLNHYHLNKAGAFADRYVFRFANMWIHTQEELDLFQRLINILNLTADPATRKSGLKEVDIQRSLAVGLTEEGRQRVIAYYGY